MRGGVGGRFGPGRGVVGGRGMFGRGNLRQSAWESMDRSTQPCVFFAQGKCVKGDVCQFSHAASMALAKDTTSMKSLPVDSPSKQEQTDRSGSLANMEHSEEPLARISHFRDRASSNVTPMRPSDGKSSDVDNSMGVRTLKTECVKPESKKTSISVSQTGMPSRLEGAPEMMQLAAGPPVVVGSDGARYMLGPDGPVPLEAVERTMGMGHSAVTLQPAHMKAISSHQPEDGVLSKRDEARVVAPRSMEKSSPQGGIIALPDGGFITRKRAAELQRSQNSNGVRELRPTSQEEEQDSALRKRRPGVTDERGASGTRVSIMDRLGPAPITQSKSSVSERTVNHVHSRPDVSEPRPVARDIKRKRTVPPERRKMGPQGTASSALSRSLALSTVRHAKVPDGPQAGHMVNLRGLDRSSTAGTSSTLDFKVPTLEEIKNRKASAQRTGGKDPEKTNGGLTYIHRRVTLGDRTETTRFVSAEKPESNGADILLEVGEASKESERVSKAPRITTIDELASLAPPAPSPKKAARIAEQSYAADMDEFSEWV